MGKIITASPNVQGANAHSVIYILKHSKGFVMGVGINTPIENVDVFTMLTRMNIPIINPARLSGTKIICGGPKNVTEGTILYSESFNNPSSKIYSISHTSSISILYAIGSSPTIMPTSFEICIGKYLWSENNIIEMIKNGRYFILNANFDLILRTPLEKRWRKTYELMGINPALLSTINTVDYDNPIQENKRNHELYKIEYNESKNNV